MFACRFTHFVSVRLEVTSLDRKLLWYADLSLLINRPCISLQLFCILCIMITRILVGTWGGGGLISASLAPQQKLFGGYPGYRQAEGTVHGYEITGKLALSVVSRS